MRNRNRLAPEERAARSRLAQLLHDREVICGSLVTMARRCGKPGCRCTKGHKHVSLYLATNLGGRRRLVYIPPELEDQVKEGVAHYQEIQRLTRTVSAACTDRVLARKRERADHG
jgi:hypothetical protein